MKSKNDSPKRVTPTTPPLPKSSLLNADFIDASLTSSSSTIVDESIGINAAVVKPLNMESQTASHVNSSPIQKTQESNLSPSQQRKCYGHNSSGSSNGSTPDLDDGMIDHSLQQHQQNGKHDDKTTKNLGNIQTYR